MHEGPKLAKDAVFCQETNFTKGGVNIFTAASEKNVASLRDGWVGWIGYGGSVFQWHPDLEIGFGWCGNFIHGADNFNIRGAKLQTEVVKCIKEAYI